MRAIERKWGRGRGGTRSLTLVNPEEKGRGCLYNIFLKGFLGVIVLFYNWKKIRIGNLHLSLLPREAFSFYLVLFSHLLSLFLFFFFLRQGLLCLSVVLKLLFSPAWPQTPSSSVGITGIVHHASLLLLQFFFLFNIPLAIQSSHLHIPRNKLQRFPDDTSHFDMAPVTVLKTSASPPPSYIFAWVVLGVGAGMCIYVSCHVFILGL